MNEKDLIDYIALSDIENNTLIKVGNKLEITKKQFNILNKYNIKYNNNSDISDIIFLIETFLNTIEDITDDEYDELSTISEELSERNYYNNTNK